MPEVTLYHMPPSGAGEIPEIDAIRQLPSPASILLCPSDLRLGFTIAARVVSIPETSLAETGISQLY